MNISQMGALNNAIENSEKLDFASRCLSEEQLVRLYKSYKQLFWAQIAPAIILAVAVILELIFIPSEAVPHGEASMKETIILFETVFLLWRFTRFGSSLRSLLSENFGISIRGGTGKKAAWMNCMQCFGDLRT